MFQLLLELSDYVKYSIKLRNKHTITFMIGLWEPDIIVMDPNKIIQLFVQKYDRGT